MPTPKPSHIWPRRDATREDRWHVKRVRPGHWIAGPLGLGVYADLAKNDRWKGFDTWAEALSYVLRRVYGR